jgi:hypothetical protein
MAVADQISKESAKRPRGRPFQKGVSGNPAGRPRGIRDRRTIRLEMMEALEEVTRVGGRTKLRALVDAIITQGLRGDVQAFREIRDTVDGRPVAQDEMPRLPDGGDNPVPVNLHALLDALPVEALRRLEAVVLEAEAKQAALNLPDARRLP